MYVLVNVTQLTSIYFDSVNFVPAKNYVMSKPTNAELAMAMAMALEALHYTLNKERRNF